MFSRRFAARAFAFLGVAAFLIAIGLPAVAMDSDGDGIPDDLEASTARNVLTHSTPGTFVVRSRSVGAPQDDAFEVSYARGEFSVGYSPKSFGSDSVSYTLEFRRIVEFTVEPGGSWEVAQERDLRADYGGVDSRNDTTSDGEREVLFDVSTQSGIFSITAGATERFARVSGRLVSPAEMKLDLSIRNWPWNRSDSRLALEVAVNTTDTARVDEVSEDEARGWASGEAQVNVTGANDSLFFSWLQTATVDGVAQPVEVTPLQGNGPEHTMYLVYPHGNVIDQDPKIGAVSEAFWSIWSRPRTPPIQADVTVYVAGLGIAAALVVITVLVARRRRET